MQEDQEGITRTIVLVILKISQGDVVLTELITLRHTDLPLKSGGLVWKCRCIYTTMCQSIMSLNTSLYFFKLCPVARITTHRGVGIACIMCRTLEKLMYGDVRVCV